jgi:integrase
MPNFDITLTSPLPLDQNPAAVYIASLSTQSGQRSQAQALRVIAQIMGTDINSLNWGALRYQHTAMIRSQISQAYSSATANKILSALRQTLKQAWLLGQMSVDEYMRARDLEPVTGETVPAGRELTPDEIAALMDACKRDKNRNAGIRDAAMIALMYIGMLRREEITTIALGDYDPQTGKLMLIGKRNKQAAVYATNGAMTALQDWLLIRGSAPGALFVVVNKSGKLDTKYNHITPQAVYFMTIKRSKQAGVEDNSPHNFRRTAISNLLDSNQTDVVTISKLARHKNVQTTARYDRRPEEAKKKAANLLHVPY